MQKIEIMPLTLLEQKGDQQFPSDNDDFNDYPQIQSSFECNHQIMDFLNKKPVIKKKKQQSLGVKLTDELYKWNAYLIHKFDVHHEE